MARSYDYASIFIPITDHKIKRLARLAKQSGRLDLNSLDPVQHITLYGEFRATKANGNKLAILLKDSMHKAKPMEIATGNLGTWKEKELNWVYLAITPSSELAHLRDEIRKALKTEFPSHPRYASQPFHISLGNKISAKQSSEIVRALKGKIKKQKLVCDRIVVAEPSGKRILSFKLKHG